MAVFYRNLIVIFGFLITSCTTKSDGSWVQTSPLESKVWLSDVDSQLTYSWEGQIFDSIAHGNGELIISKKGSIVNRLKVKAIYGAINHSDIVSVGTNEQYIGNTKEELFEGYGVYIKGSDIYIGNFHKGQPHGHLTLYRNKKIYYTGSWNLGLFHGKGTFYKEDGTVKIGEWEHGELTQTFVDSKLSNGHYKGYVKNTYPDGLGVMKYNNGNEFQGSWKQGNYHGLGLLLQDQDSIFGYWNEGKLTGDALYKTSSFIYDGGFVDNIPTGIGCLISSDGNYYSGSWIDGKRNGIGDIFFANGDRYSGEWENNEFHGIGKFIYNHDNSSYEGEWKNGLQDGQGNYNSPNFYYRGDWEKGWMDGEGILVFKNGDRYEGTIHENKIDGIGCYEYANGNRYEGEFVSGIIWGNGIFQFKDGNRFEGEFYKGKIYGDGTLLLKTKDETVAITGFWPLEGGFPKEASMLFENGDLYEGPLVNGYPSPNGVWVSGEERLKKIEEIESSTIHKANEFYKKHRETINWYLVGASAIVTAIEASCASTVIGAPFAVIAHGINVGINVIDATASMASAGIDAAEARARGEDASEAEDRLLKEVGMNVALVLVPKVISKGVKPLNKAIKGVFRSSAALVGRTGTLIKKSALKFGKGKLCNKVSKLSISIQSGGRKVEKALIQSKTTRDLMIASGRLLTKLKHQVVTYNAYLTKIKKRPELFKKLNLTGEGSSKVLEKNMRLMGLEKWLNKNERIKRYLGLKRQVEAHHIIPSNPMTESAKKAKEIWVKYFGSVDHPCNGIWLGRSNKSNGYKFLAKGSNHSPNTREYEEYVGKFINDTYNKYKKQYANNPEMMQKVLAESVDEIKKKLYKGNLAIGGASHQVHTTLSIFKESGSIIKENAQPLINSIQIATK
ncbi:AHH domain-containing protein [Capnocytophaga canimorsus]|uniref:AHH domain-containing protein n=1 Tax=Capnocytophaga canimorsus TaxID=28188 RepID=UPI0037D2B060